MLLPFLFAAVATCSSRSADGAASLASDVRATAAFVEVDPSHSSAAFRRSIESALTLLEESATPVALATVKAIRSGRVTIDELSDLTRADRRHVQDGYAREHHRAPKNLADDLNGYMWDERVYVARGLGAKKLARTLAHEVNHVFNRSEENYRGARATLREEYRAHLAETLAFAPMPSPGKLLALKLRVITNYDLDLTPDEVADVPPGMFE